MRERAAAGCRLRADRQETENNTVFTEHHEIRRMYQLYDAHMLWLFLQSNFKNKSYQCNILKSLKHGMTKRAL